jgi:hypothetical protein
VARRRSRKHTADRPGVPAYRVRLPGFITGDEIGLGTAIKRATSYFGIRPCGGCQRRAAALDRWMIFTR